MLADLPLLGIIILSSMSEAVNLRPSVLTVKQSRIRYVGHVVARPDRPCKERVDRDLLRYCYFTT